MRQAHTDMTTAPARSAPAKPGYRDRLHGYGPVVGLVLLSAWHLLREAVDVLMEAAPRDLDLQRVEGELAGLPGVRRVHDLHVWTIGSGEVCLSCHLVVSDAGGATALLSDAYRLLGSRFGIDHATLQIEPEGFAGQTPRSLCAGACNPARTAS